MARKGTTGGVPRNVLRERESQAWALTQQGLTHERIAAEMNLERSTVTKILIRVAKRANETMIDQMVSEKMAQVARLAFIVDEAMQAWARSKDAAKTVRRQQTEPTKLEPPEETPEGDAPKKRGRPAGVTKTVIYTQIQDQDGDPRYLSTAMQAMADIRKVLGLDAPNRNLNIDLNQLTDAQLEKLAAGADILDVLSTARMAEEITPNE